MASRVGHLIKRGLKFAEITLEHPGVIPALVRDVGIQHAHLGEVLNAGRHRKWLLGAGIQTIIDVGAHQGEFASGMKSTLPGVQVYSFEPQPECYTALAERLQQYPHTQAFCLALGSTAGQLSFHQSVFTKSSSLLPLSQLHKDAFPFTAETHLIQVEVVTLDSLANQLNLTPKVMLKLDVQGYELEVLKGAQKILPKVDYVLAETSVGGTLYEGEANLKQLEDFLESFGFKFAFRWDQLENPQDGSVLQVDAMFVRAQMHMH
jgi:FkbM family methyltransferase